MRIADLKGTYDAIFSLGDLCLASMQLEKFDLRPYAGPLDWMATHNLADVNRLLRNHFANFMEYNNLVVEKRISDQLYLVRETNYDFLSNHDFFTHNNFPPYLAAYPEVKAKYDRRVQRFMEKMAYSPNILFIRTEGSFEHAQELQTVLSGLVAHDFKVLLINHTAVPNVVETDWPLEKICSIQLPNDEKWDGNDHLWADIFNGIHLNED
ncbi:DUF1796 family putative cysteine peptidase [Paenibacillus dokdonensis]|uniref:DUF1796 family putative cysteine peptidase n=1 Tax=Paenibacillus dokdonensis TaxID=2567944 RepID=A0ABU6GU86_9BACL|nr:DUF1796 family putative cysteine peptidase [Paenibacillus dokdonensis]MEC0241717.1 DUF1796 family putative cysteine peptidase [Paenibacillus dokdonensis]